MNLTDFLISRQHGLSENIVVENETVLLKDINAVIELHHWSFCDIKRFNDFVSTYTFPKNEEFSKKDRDGIRQNIPRPQILIKKQDGTPRGNNPIIAMYLYQKAQLTGDTLLHIRSINKFEQMWIPYFVNLQTFQRSNPRIIKKEFYEYCQSSEMEFTYKFLYDSKVDSARLRIITFAFNNYILLMYVFDKNENELTQEDLNLFIDSIKKQNE
jgi:hypothetical protein